MQPISTLNNYFALNLISLLQTKIIFGAKSKNSFNQNIFFSKKSNKKNVSQSEKAEPIASNDHASNTHPSNENGQESNKSTISKPKKIEIITSTNSTSKTNQSNEKQKTTNKDDVSQPPSAKTTTIANDTAKTNQAKKNRKKSNKKFFSLLLVLALLIGISIVYLQYINHEVSKAKNFTQQYFALYQDSADQRETIKAFSLSDSLSDDELESEISNLKNLFDLSPNIKIEITDVEIAFKKASLMLNLSDTSNELSPITSDLKSIFANIQLVKLDGNYHFNFDQLIQRLHEQGYQHFAALLPEEKPTQMDFTPVKALISNFNDAWIDYVNNNGQSLFEYTDPEGSVLSDIKNFTKIHMPSHLKESFTMMDIKYIDLLNEKDLAYAKVHEEIKHINGEKETLMTYDWIYTMVKKENRWLINSFNFDPNPNSEQIDYQYNEAYLLKTTNFISKGVLTGGNDTATADINAIRYGKHDGFERIVLDTAPYSSDQTDSRYLAEPTEFNVIFKDSKQAIISLDNCKNISGKTPWIGNSDYLKNIETDISQKEGQSTITIDFKESVNLRIFELHDPGRIVIDIKNPA